MVVNGTVSLVKKNPVQYILPHQGQFKSVIFFSIFLPHRKRKKERKTEI